MKLILLVLKSILNMITTQTRIFLIIVLSMAISVNGAFLIYNLYSTQKDNMANDKKARHISYQLTFKHKNNFKANQDILKHILNNTDLSSNMSMEIKPTNIDQGNQMCITGYFNKKNEISMSEGRPFLQSETNKGENVAIVSVASLNYSSNITKIDSNFKYEGINYKIVGAYNSFEKGIYIPYTTYFKNSLVIDNVVFTFESTFTNKQEQSLKNEIGNTAIVKQTSRKIDIKNENNIIISIYSFMILVLFGFTIINIINLFVFWIKQNAYKFSIYNLCGAKKNHINIIVISESAIISIFSFILGYVIYNFVIVSVKSKFGLNTLNILDDLFVFTVFICCILISISTILIKTATNYPINRES